MPCNPSIGGPAKGHLVREIDALGGEMGYVADHASIQMRMLNTAKGPAVHALRAQADKLEYQKIMRCSLMKESLLQVRQLLVDDIILNQQQVQAVRTENGEIIYCSAVVIATGTYMRSRIILGDVSYNAGPNGQRNSEKLSESLAKLGIMIRRFKTGTPARIDARSVDFSLMKIQPGDIETHNFSFISNIKHREQQPCFLTSTGEETHKIIRANLHRAPLYSGLIEGTGPRYCPSIEVKIVNFPDKETHQVFIEPEGVSTHEMYIQGMSTSLPFDVQKEMLRTIPGLENVEIMRYGYAIEYDCIDPTQLNHALSFKNYCGLFSAGQVNGSSGYEEAAAQGLIAGMNAALFVKGASLFTLQRSDAYIGVLVDDLVIKGTNEPYRMMTSRSEYRLLLRFDNADLRLTEMGHSMGLVSTERIQKFHLKKCSIDYAISFLKAKVISPSKEVQDFLRAIGSSELRSGSSLFDLLKRQEITYTKLQSLFELPELEQEVMSQVDIMIKYEGYIKKQKEQVQRALKLENQLLSDFIDYNSIRGLSKEAQQKLQLIKPSTMGQAARISGVSPADITILVIHQEQNRR